MRLIVKQGEHAFNEFKFGKGPIYIGRHTHSQVFLPDQGVSRQHAVIFTTQEGNWVVEDLDSANKTYLNDEAIHKADIKDKDVLRITDFTIEISLENDESNETGSRPIDLGDTLPTSTRQPQIIVRTPDADRAPAMRLPGKRAKDFVKATEALSKANSLDKVLLALLDIVGRQFAAYHMWGALRKEASGPMVCHTGKRRDGQKVELGEVKLKDKITEALENGQFLLMPRVPVQAEDEKVQSAIIAPIVGLAGCFGVLYLDNATDHERYAVGDLDYMMLLAIHTAAIVEKL